MNKLWAFKVNFGRDGRLEGLFIATDEEIQTLNHAYVHFGEVLGKHSEVWIADFSIEEFLTCVSDDQALVNSIEKTFRSRTLLGYNPLNYIHHEEEDE